MVSVAATTNPYGLEQLTSPFFPMRCPSRCGGTTAAAGWAEFLGMTPKVPHPNSCSLGTQGGVIPAMVVLRGTADLQLGYHLRLVT